MTREERRIRELGIELPPPGVKPETRTRFILHEDLLFLGAVCAPEEEKPEDAARAAARELLTLTKEALGSLERVSRVLRATVWIAGAKETDELEKTADAASDTLTEALGARGLHTRTVLGVCTLPKGALVMCDAIMQVRRSST